MNWYYNIGEAKIGPVNDKQILELSELGKITRETMVWNKLGRHVASLSPSSYFAYRVFTLHLTKGSPLFELRRPGPRRHRGPQQAAEYE